MQLQGGLYLLAWIVLPVFLCFSIVFSDFSFAGEPLRLTLDEAVLAALGRNLSVAEKELLVKKGEAGVMAAEGEFDPVIGLGVERQFDKESEISILTSAEEDTYGYNVSLGGKLRTGTEYALTYEGGKIESSENFYLLTNPYYSSGVELSLSQPLLNGFGIGVQESLVTVAEKELQMARLEAQGTSAEVAASTADAYWELYFARNELDVAGLSLRLAEGLLDEARARVKAGALPSYEIYSAEAEVAERKRKLLEARKAVFDAEDALRDAMNPEDLGGEIIPLDSPAEPGEDFPPIEQFMETALSMREDYKKAKVEYEAFETLCKYYLNQTLPDLDLTGSVGLSGMSGSYGDAVDDTTGGDYYSWGVGLSLSVPLGNRGARGEYLKAQRDLEIAEVGLKMLERSIALEVRRVHRSLLLARETVEAARQSRVAIEKRLMAEEEKFRLGIATLNDTLKSQEEYALSIIAEQRALVDYEKALVGIKKATGTLLESFADAGAM